MMTTTLFRKTFFLSIYFEIQSTFKYLREIFVNVGFTTTSKLYVLFKTGPQWQVNTRQLLAYPSNTLGYHVGCFLLQHKFEPQPHCESHDVFHVLTGFKVDTAQEIAMQFWLYGNGKRSLFVLLAMAVGMVLYWDWYSAFAKAYTQGKHANPITHLDFKKKLSTPISLIKQQINL